MAPIYWIVGLVVITLLFWWASRGNGRHLGHKRRLGAATELVQENHRLRHVLAQMAVENHELKNSKTLYW